MATSVSEIGILRPVIETVPDDDVVTIRVTRVASAAISSGGYKLYRARQRSGFAGLATSDSGGFQFVGNLAQFSETAVFANMTDASPPDSGGVDVFYRVLAVDDTATPTQRSHWSNLVSYRYITDRLVAIPTFPSELRLNTGILKGVVPAAEGIQDADGSAGVTWYEIRRAMADAAGVVEEALAQRLGDAAAYDLFRDPPADLIRWYEALAITYLIPSLGITTIEKEDEEHKHYLELAHCHRDLLLRESIRVPGGKSWPARGGLILRG